MEGFMVAVVACIAFFIIGGVSGMQKWRDFDTTQKAIDICKQRGGVEKYWKEEVKCNNGGTFSMEGNQ